MKHIELIFINIMIKYNIIYLHSTSILIRKTIALMSL